MDMEILKIYKELSGDSLTLLLEGRLDTTTQPLSSMQK